MNVAPSFAAILPRHALVPPTVYGSFQCYASCFLSLCLFVDEEYRSHCMSSTKVERFALFLVMSQDNV